VEQQPQRLRPQGSRDRDSGGSTLDRRTEGRLSRTKASLKATSPDAAYRVGVRLLTVRDRTRAELACLLGVRGFDRADSQVALDRLQEQGYLNDRRFATTWARGRLRTKPMGSYRLGKELEVKGVEDQLVREILGDLYEEGEEPVARRALAGKLSVLGRLPASARTLRVGRFLHRRGFSSELIWRLLHEEQQG
jgi:regulatory protein